MAAKQGRVTQERSDMILQFCKAVCLGTVDSMDVKEIEIVMKETDQVG